MSGESFRCLLVFCFYGRSGRGDIFLATLIHSVCFPLPSPAAFWNGSACLRLLEIHTQDIPGRDLYIDVLYSSSEINSCASYTRAMCFTSCYLAKHCLPSWSCLPWDKMAKCVLEGPSKQCAKALVIPIILSLKAETSLSTSGLIKKKKNHLKPKWQQWRF